VSAGADPVRWREVLASFVAGQGRPGRVRVHVALAGIGSLEVGYFWRVAGSCGWRWVWVQTETASRLRSRRARIYVGWAQRHRDMPLDRRDRVGSTSSPSSAGC